MLFEQKIGVKGIVDSLQVVNADGSIAQELGPFDNLVLDQGLSKTQNAVFFKSVKAGGYDVGTPLTAYLAIGVGDTTPATTDVGLENEKARTGTILSKDRTLSAAGSDPFYVTGTIQYETAKGSLDSSVDGTYKEIGLSDVSSAGDNLFTRTLIKDASGNPTTVSVASDQKLRVTYRIQISMQPTSKTAASFDITNIGTVNYQHQIFYANDAIGQDGTNGGSDLCLEPNGWATDAGLLLLVDLDRSSTPTWSAVGNKHNYWGLAVNQTFEEPTYNNNISFSEVSTGVFEMSYTLGTGEGNMTYDAVLLAPPGYPDNAGWGALFDAADAFTKDDLHELTLTWRITVGRA